MHLCGGHNVAAFFGNKRVRSTRRHSSGHHDDLEATFKKSGLPSPLVSGDFQRVGNRPLVAYFKGIRSERNSAIDHESKIHDQIQLAKERGIPGTGSMLNTTFNPYSSRSISFTHVFATTSYKAMRAGLP
jgi:hypothetical protein